MEIKRKKKLPQDLILIILGLLLLIFLIGTSGYLFSFLNNNVFSALAPGQDNGERIRFNLDEYKSLGIE